MIERTLNPKRKRTRAPPSKRKLKAKTRVRKSTRRAPKRAAKRPQAKKKTQEVDEPVTPTSRLAVCRLPGARIVPHMAPAGLIPLNEAQKRLPGNPSIRWISTEARRLGCYRRVAKEAYIIERAWNHFGVSRGDPCQLA